MRVVRSSFPSLLLLAAALVFAGCNGGGDTNANTATNSGNATNASTNNAANNAAANDTHSAENHDGHNHAPGAHGAPANAAPTGEKVGVTTTKPGTGVGAKDGDLLMMRYTGRLTNGKVFDSNVNKDPFNLVLGQGGVIRGWEEGLQGVKVGEKRTLNIPASKGYGEQGAGADIPPNSDLVFDIECLYIVPGEKSSTVTREALKTGTGPAIKENQTVTFHFKGTLVDGKEFDSSYAAKKPITVKLGSETLQPIGLETAMVGMRVGGRYRLMFPPAVGFGPGGSSKVPGNSVVFFEIEPLSAK